MAGVVTGTPVQTGAKEATGANGVVVVIGNGVVVKYGVVAVTGTGVVVTDVDIKLKLIPKNIKIVDTNINRNTIILI